MLIVMSLPSQACIRAFNSESKAAIHFAGFDGDDCFASLRVTVTERGVTRRFELGGAVVWSLRWLNRFFENKTLERTQGGLSVYRHGANYRLLLESAGKEEEFRLSSPAVVLDHEFLPRYDGTET